MPNWFHNDIEITGPEADLSRFLAEYINTTDKERPACDFDKIIPQPQEVLQDVAAEPPGASPLWYTWRNQNWGTKWNASDSYVGERDPERIRLGFQTANGVPDPIYRAIAARFPTLSIRVEYVDFPNCTGELHYRKGKVEHIDHTKEMIAANPDFFGEVAP
jgi:hypothetical protein